MSELPIAVPGRKTGYRVRLAVFEGPLDLLLHLIEREELDITRVSLARVADQYLEYLEALDEIQAEDLADFINVAARLLLIKSQVLLPRPVTHLPQEDEDAGDELLRQLIAYKKFKEAARTLDQRQSEGKRSFVRLAPRAHIDAGIEFLEPVSLDALLAAARRAIQTRPATPPVNDIIHAHPISMTDQIALITRRLERVPQVTFTSLLTTAYTRHEVAVTLLALLEMIKQRRIRAVQEKMFGDIWILHVPDQERPQM